MLGYHLGEGEEKVGGVCEGDGFGGAGFCCGGGFCVLAIIGLGMIAVE